MLKAFVIAMFFGFTTPVILVLLGIWWFALFLAFYRVIKWTLKEKSE